ncbi:MAG: hypothetical protein Q9170_000603 [Blastenia crenularia]
MPVLGHPIHGSHFIRPLIPKYLFRVSSASSQGSREGKSFVARSKKPSYISPEGYRKAISEHLDGKGGDSFFISTTSSLLRALVFARYKCLRGEQQTRIAIIDSRRIPVDKIFAATYLVEQYAVPPRQIPWHDHPDGEYLVEYKIEADAVLGETAYETVASPIADILPELTDKPHQLTEELRMFLFRGEENLSRAVKQQAGDADVTKEYEAARRFSEAFKLGSQNETVLTLMCMALRKRGDRVLEQSDFFKDLSGTKAIVVPWV